MGQWDNVVGKALCLAHGQPVSIPCAPYGPLTLSGVIHECRTGSVTPDYCQLLSQKEKKKQIKKNSITDVGKSHASKQDRQVGKALPSGTNKWFPKRRKEE